MREPIDQILKGELARWEAQIEVLKKAESIYFTLDASEKTIFSKIVIRADGNTVSSREAFAYSHPDYVAFKEGLAKAHSDYLHEKRRLDLIIKSFDAYYLTFKLHNEVIRRQT